MNARDDFPYRERNVPLYVSDRALHEAMCDEIDRLRMSLQSQYSRPTLNRDIDGRITIKWGTPNNEMMPWPVIIVPELLVEMVEAFNRTFVPQ